MQRNLEMEEEAGKIPILKAQIEDLKRQVVNMKAEKSVRSEGNFKYEMEVEELKREVNALKDELAHKNDEIEHIRSRADHLEHELEKAKEKALESHEGRERSEELISSFTEILTPEIKEKLLRLERENERLKGMVGGGEGATMAEIERLRQQLDLAGSITEKYEQELHSYRQQINQAKNAGEGGAALEVLRKQNEELEAGKREAETRAAVLEQRLKTLESENQKLRASGAAGTAGGAALPTDVAALQKQCTAAEEKIQQLQAYLRTAKTMIREYRSKQTAELEKQKHTYEEVIQSYKNQLAEKAQELQALKMVMKESKECSEREQKLLVSAFYDMGLQLARVQAPRPNATPTATTPNHKPKSWLANVRGNRNTNK